MNAHRLGKPTDMSAPPIYPRTIIKMVQMLSLEGSQDSALIKFVLLLVLNVGARSTEVAHIILDSMRFDSEFKCVAGELPQTKSSKVKIFSIQAGVNRFFCWFLAFADFLCLCERPLWEPIELDDEDSERGWST